MEEMLRIGQVAKLYGISLDTLRLYEKKGLLIPHVCKENRYRYYSVSQLDTLELILNSKNAGMALQDVAEILKAENLVFYLDMFKKQEKVLEAKINLLEQTKKYAREKIQVIQQILIYQEGDRNESQIQDVAEEITLYLIDLKVLLTIGANPSQTEGMDLLETWRLFNISENQEPSEDVTLAVFSFQPSKDESILEKDFLKLYEQGVVRKQRISCNYKKCSFLGTNEEIAQYINVIKNRIPLYNPMVYVKNCYTIINLEKENKYFVELYFHACT